MQSQRATVAEISVSAGSRRLPAEGPARHDTRHIRRPLRVTDSFRDDRPTSEVESGEQLAPLVQSEHRGESFIDTPEVLDAQSADAFAESLDISEHTVKVHLWRLFRRLNVKSRSQASHLARTKGLV